jgi:hypothetical protein
LALVLAPVLARWASVLRTDRATRLMRWWGVFLTFHLVVLAWIFFRASTVQDAFVVVQELFSGTYDTAELNTLRKIMGSTEYDITLLLVPLFFLLDPLFDAVVKGQRTLGGWRGMLAFGGLLVAIVLIGHFGSTSFIYFQF